MQTAHHIGFSPQTIIDVGAARGRWSLEVSTIWPAAHYLLIDPLVENKEELQNTCKELRRAEYIMSALTDKAGSVTLHVHPDLEGSSLFLERENNINGTPREVPACSLDSLIGERNLLPPMLLKIDVQGAEIYVLKGVAQSLPSIEMIVLEVLLFDIYQGMGPQLFDTVIHMQSNGFVVWDIFGMGYRPLDNALCQVDIVFVRDNGRFRCFHQYATPEQRQLQLDALGLGHPKRLRDR